jgi:hypothetical protein
MCKVFCGTKPLHPWERTEVKPLTIHDVLSEPFRWAAVMTIGLVVAVTFGIAWAVLSVFSPSPRLGSV